MSGSTIRSQIESYLVEHESESAFLRSEFSACGKSRSGVDNAIRAMIADGLLVRVGYGIYVRSERRISSITGNEITGPVEVPDVWVPELLRKLGVEPRANSAVRAYNERRTTQVPAWICYEIGSSRLRRKIRIGKGVVKYERNGQLVDLNASSKR
ncbi:hypothetical protein [Ferrimicrobium sp.]|uniref:hypothetical protein n=1 Tax=Ferrimicrobium sp. TaxID=2926050 RepID=UPI0026259B0B|nr:hypothetical protein [Ferrimicrobium sp.]